MQWHNIEMRFKFFESIILEEDMQKVSESNLFKALRHV